MLYQELLNKGRQLLAVTPEGPDSNTEQDLANLKDKWEAVQGKAAERKVRQSRQRRRGPRESQRGGRGPRAFSRELLIPRLVTSAASTWLQCRSQLRGVCLSRCTTPALLSRA